MFLRVDTIVMCIAGTIIIFLAKTIGYWLFKNNWAIQVRGPRDNKLLYSPLARQLFYVWPLRGVGISLVIIGLASSRYPPNVLDTDAERISLLQKGVVTEATVLRVYYGEWAPKGWKVEYSFKPETTEAESNSVIRWVSRGPKKYFDALSADDLITVIYSPDNPEINSEIRCLLNHPITRSTLKRARKKELLDKFREKYVLEEYSFNEWYDLQQTRKQ
jgi:hypothetical protein